MECGETGKIEEDYYTSKKEFMHLAMYLFVHICLHCLQTPRHPNQNLKRCEPGHTPAGALTVHEFGSNELLFGVFIRRWNVLPDVYLAVLNAEQNSTR